MSKEAIEQEYPIGFLNEIELDKKNQILHKFINLVFRGYINMNDPDMPKEIRGAFVDLYIEADKAAKSMEEKLEFSLAANREERRKMEKKLTVKERAKAAGLHTVTSSLEKKKGNLIL